MNVKRKRIATSFIVALMVLSFSMVNSVSATYLLPQLEVKPATGSTTLYEVWLTGEGGADLEAYWDIIGFETYLRFDAALLETISSNVTVDPAGWFASFWPLGIATTLLSVDNTRGIVRVSVIGRPANTTPTGHTPPSGKGCIFSVDFSWKVSPCSTKPHLRNPEPRPEMLPDWGRDKFMTDLVGFPHPERTDPPWKGAEGSAKIPHVVLPTLPVASFTESLSTAIKGTTINFNASGSYDQPPGWIVTYEWDWESDGIINATGVTASVTYTKVGTYLVTLVVTDNEGLTGSASATKTITSMPPVVKILWSSSPLNLKPNADGTCTGMTGNYTLWDDWPSPDGNATYVKATAGGQYQSSNLEDVVNPTGPISWVKVYVVARSMMFSPTVVGNDRLQLMLVIAGTKYPQPPGIPFAGYGLTSTYAAYSYTWYTNPKTGLNWTWSDINATEAGVASILVPPVFTEIRITQLYLEVGRPGIPRYTGIPIAFDASASYDPDGTISTYYWDWNDGNPGTAAKITSYKWMYPGTFTVTLRLTDNDYTINTGSVSVTILDGVPRAIFTTNATTVYTNEAVKFDASASYDPDGTIDKYTWTFKKLPEEAEATISGSASVAKIVAFSWSKPYNYKVLLEVFDNLGVSSAPTIWGIQTKTNVTITVLNRPPVAIFTENATTVYKNEAISFDVSASYDPDGTIIYYSFDWGDGTMTSFGNQELHMENLATDGLYGPGSGKSWTWNKTDQWEFMYKDVDFSSSVTVGDTRLTPWSNIYGNVTYGCMSTVAAGDLDIGIILVRFADNEKHTENIAVNGMYDATEFLYRDADLSGTVTKGDTRLTPVPKNATYNYARGSVVAVVKGVADIDIGWALVRTRFVPPITHSYATSGIYTVTLTVTDNSMASATATAIKQVKFDPIAIIEPSTTTPTTTNQTIVFDGTHSYDPDGYIVSYEWDFGDGTTDTSANVTHAYMLRGFYVASLKVTDNEGYTNTATIMIEVHALQRGMKEHAVYRVSQDEDEYNTLSAVIMNNGTATADVKVVFTVFDFRTGGTLGSLETTGTVLADQILTLSVDFNPFDFEYEQGTEARYFVYAKLYYFDGEWIPDESSSGTFKIVFKVRP